MKVGHVCYSKGEFDKVKAFKIPFFTCTNSVTVQHTAKLAKFHVDILEEIKWTPLDHFTLYKFHYKAAMLENLNKV